MEKYKDDGSVNTGRSWHSDRRQYNKSEDWEKPMNKRKQRYDDGGGVSYGDIKKEKEKMTDDLLKKCGVFFAFSNEQFNENKTPLKEGEKYVSIGGGGYMPKSNVDDFREGMKAIKQIGKKKVKENNLAETEILYELNNHECFYTGDYSDVVDMFEGTYTEKQIRDVYNKHRESNESFKKGGGINSGRDLLFKSKQPHEQKYQRKTEWKEYKKEGWFGDWFANGGGVGRVKVGVFNENQLRNKEDKKAVEKFQKETGLKYVDTKIIKKGGKMFMEVYLIPNEDYYNSSKYANGGGIYEGNENALMVMNNNKQIKHHTQELGQAVNKDSEVPAWVVAKVNRSASDLSDATHYMDGVNSYAQGGGVGEKITIETVEFKLGRKLHWWNDDVVMIDGMKFKKCFLQPFYIRKI